MPRPYTEPPDEFEPLPLVDDEDVDFEEDDEDEDDDEDDSDDEDDDDPIDEPRIAASC